MTNEHPKNLDIRIAVYTHDGFPWDESGEYLPINGWLIFMINPYDIPNPPVIPGEYRCEFGTHKSRTTSGDVKRGSNTSSNGVWMYRECS